MRISINLEFDNGDFGRGFTNQLTVTDATSNSIITHSSVQLSPKPEIAKSYKSWQEQYINLVDPNSHRGRFKDGSRNFSLQRCAEQAKALRRLLHEWLQPIKLELEPVLQHYPNVEPNVEICLVIHTQKVKEHSTLDPDFSQDLRK